MKMEKYYYFITYWVIIISITILCGMGKFNDELYLFIMGVIFGSLIYKHILLDDK